MAGTVVPFAAGGPGREAGTARSPFRPSRPPVCRWHFTASPAPFCRIGRLFALRNSLMHGPFPRMHGRLPIMHAPFPLVPVHSRESAVHAANERCVSGNAPLIRRLGRSLPRVAQAGTAQESKRCESKELTADDTDGRGWKSKSARHGAIRGQNSHRLLFVSAVWPFIRVRRPERCAVPDAPPGEPGSGGAGVRPRLFTFDDAFGAMSRAWRRRPARLAGRPRDDVWLLRR